jgi:hypothetical protein
MHLDQHRVSIRTIRIGSQGKVDAAKGIRVGSKPPQRSREIQQSFRVLWLVSERTPARLVRFRKPPELVQRSRKQRESAGIVRLIRKTSLECFGSHTP